MKRSSVKDSDRASLMALGHCFQRQGIWQVVADQVHIPQKVVRYTPQDTLLDSLIDILAGGSGLVEVNLRVRQDEVLSWAFGRQGCAEPSTVSETFNACRPQTVQQMRQALKHIYRRHSRAWVSMACCGWCGMGCRLAVGCSTTGQGVSYGSVSTANIA